MVRTIADSHKRNRLDRRRQQHSGATCSETPAQIVLVEAVVDQNQMILVTQPIQPPDDSHAANALLVLSQSPCSSYPYTGVTVSLPR
jgi:hypothetical protein